ncbi:MAG: ribonuclease HII [Candidatus Altiarchaeales archaeon]|nr:ribonuclease HII [Candidatus Altiarchaeales archaeon]
MTDFFCGVDEAGRGPVVGPMVIAAAAFTRNSLKKIAQLKVRDSKKMSPKRRLQSEPRIKEIAQEYAVIRVQPHQIDRLRSNCSLNQIEADKTAQLILSLSNKPHRIIVDACDSDAKNYLKRIKKALYLLNPDYYIPHMDALHRAEDRYLEVAAASVLAKVERDRVAEKLKVRWGDFGSGYPADEVTKRWLNEILESGDSLPPIIRKSWNTVKRRDENQTTLEGWGHS